MFTKRVVNAEWGSKGVGMRAGHLGAAHGGDRVSGSVPNKRSWWSKTLMKKSPNDDKYWFDAVFTNYCTVFSVMWCYGNSELQE